MNLEGIGILKNWVENSNNIVFFGGAGVSTESGIPDFRSVDGLYNVKYDYPPETIISHSFFMKNREEFYRFYWDKMIYPQAKPNITHKKLAELEEKGKLKAVVTQNIDGLHQAAGSKNVLELHGSVLRNYCMSCGKHYSLDEVVPTKEVENRKENKEQIQNKEEIEKDVTGKNGREKNKMKETLGIVPVCECGGIIKPDVVLYEEGLDETTIKKAIYYISNADVLIIGGTSLSVYPAAGLVRYYQGSKLVLINKTPTAYDKNADLLLPYGLGEVFSNI